MEKHMSADEIKNKFDVDKPEIVMKTKSASKIKRELPAKSNMKNKRAKTTNDQVLPKNKSKTKNTTTTKECDKPAKGKAKKVEEFEEELDEELDEKLNDGIIDKLAEEFNQGPDAKPAKDFTSGAFVVLKTDMIDEGHPCIWKIDGDKLLKKYMPFKSDGKILYKDTTHYDMWSSNLEEKFYAAPVKFIEHTKHNHILEFYKDKIVKDPGVKKYDEEEDDDFEEEEENDDDEEEDDDEEDDDDEEEDYDYDEEVDDEEGDDEH